MDDTDKKIVDALKENARGSFVDIAKRLKVSEASVRRRVNTLIENDTIRRFTVEFGETGSTKAIVLVSVDSTIDTAAVSQKLARMNGVQTVYEITGQYDIVVVMMAPNISEINSGIDSLRKIPGVSDTNTVIILRTVM